MKRLFSTILYHLLRGDRPRAGQSPGAAPSPPQQNYNAQRLPFETPPLRVGPSNDRRPGKGRGNDWQRRQAELEQEVRDAMSANGFTDVAVQNAILEHIKSEAKARAPLRERGRRLFRGLNSPKVNDAEMSLALGAYITAVDGDRARRAAAEQVLDDKIGWSKNPRLHSMLLLFGIIGESPITLPIRNFSQPPRSLVKPLQENTPPDTPPAPPPGPPPATEIPLDDAETADVINDG